MNTVKDLGVNIDSNLRFSFNYDDKAHQKGCTGVASTITSLFILSKKHSFLSPTVMFVTPILHIALVLHYNHWLVIINFFIHLLKLSHYPFCCGNE